MSVAGFNPVIAAQTSDIPRGLQKSEAPRPIPLKVRTAVVPSQSGAQSASGSILFQISDQSAFIKPGSVFIKLRVELTMTAGPANTTVYWGNTSRSGDALISRLVISSGSQLEAISNYGLMVGQLVTHASNSSYSNGDHRVMTGGNHGPVAAGVGGWVDVAAAGVSNQTLDICLPVMSNLFNSEMAYPLALLAAPTMIQCDLASVGVAFSFSSAPAAATFTVSNAQLVYDAIVPDSSFVQLTRAQLQRTAENPNGLLYSMPFVSCLSVQNAAAIGSNTFNQGLGLSSLKSYVAMMTVNPNTPEAAKLSIQNNLQNLRTYIDGQQQSSLVLDSATSQYCSLQKSYGLLGDVNRTSAAPGVPGPYADHVYANTDFNLGTYVSSYFGVGESFVKIHEGGFSNNGTSVSQFQVILDGLAAACTVTSFYWHDLILAIDSNGSATIIR